MQSSKWWSLSILFASGLVTSVLFTNCGDSFTAVDTMKYVSAAAGVGSDGDPLTAYAWHIHNSGQKVFSSTAGTVGNDLNLESTWTQGIYGKGVVILVSDDGIEDTHPDLVGNYNYGNVSKDYYTSSPFTAARAAPRSSEDNHGTSVAGLISATAGNGIGSRGVAPLSTVACENFLSSGISQTTAILADQVAGNADVWNMSWGGAQNELSSPISGFENQVRYGIANYRSGKGAIYVKSAGNEFFVSCRSSSTSTCIGNSNFDAENASPFFMTVAALDAQGYAASYSSPGSNLWISSFGGEFGDDSPAMVTTDRTTCGNGFSSSSSKSKVAFEKGGDGNAGCSYTATFNGTSSAAPILAGATALLLEANPSLTWRDVKYILAKTATPVDYFTTGSVSHPLKTTMPSGYAWEQAWVVNGAGFRFHNWYGFGRVNVDAAVKLAQNYSSPLGSFAETNWAHTVTPNIGIPDFSATGASSTMSVGSNLKIEGVQLRVWISHTDISELALELTSPSGTKSILVNARNAMTGLGNYAGQTFLSNAFYQESSMGNWTLKVIDAKSNAVTGTLTQWSLNFVGGQ